jgi:hypothetical protein
MLTERRHRLTPRPCVVRAGARLLDDVLSSNHGPGHPRAVAVEVGSHVGNQCQEALARLVELDGERVPHAQPSSAVMPVSPLKP